MDINNLIIDRILKGVMVNTADNSVLWSVNQITNPSLSCTAESTDAVDMMGSPIMTFDRSKKAEFSAENSIFDLALAAAQFGTEKQLASASSKMIVPTFETLKVKGATVTLKHKPTDILTSIYLVKPDTTLGTKFVNGSEASETVFVHAADQTTVTVPTGLKDGAELFVVYEYETESAVIVDNSAVNFPKSGKFIMEILGCDVCDATKLIHAYVEFPKAKLSSEVDMTFTTEGTHNFKITCLPDFCDSEKRLFRIVVPDEE